jgi:GT2 family glycosyltransferase
MSTTIQISGSIVLYNENIDELTNTIACFLSIPLTKKLFLIDNTPTKKFQTIFNQPEIVYIGLGKNIGFGAGHNTILPQISEISNYHLIVNPDVTFSTTTISNLILELEKDTSIAMIAPRVLFPNKEHQYSCRRYPTLLELSARRFQFLSWFNKKVIEHGIYKDKDITKPFYAAYLTGCFQLYNTKDLVAINGFDERYFLYMEDVDICRKIEIYGKKKLYYPKEEIIHVLKKGSQKNSNLFYQHVLSVFQYFMKWK